MTTRRSFLRIAGLATFVPMLTAPRWAAAGRGSPTLRRFTSAMSPGAVVRYGPLTLVWLHGGEAGALPVATLDDAQASGSLVITELGSATVPELIVENRGKVHVLLLAGEILVGGKQNRVLREDLLLPPRSGRRSISVYCVEQGRWSGNRYEFKSEESVAQPSLRRELLGRADQNRVWGEVHRSLRAYGGSSAASPSENYQRLYEAPEVRKRLDDGERAVDERAAPGAVGAVVLMGGRIAGLDAFQDTGLFKREWRKLLRAHLVESYGVPLPQPLHDDEIRRRIGKLLAAIGDADGAARGNAGVGHLFEFREQDFRGASLEHEARVVHLAVV